MSSEALCEECLSCALDPCDVQKHNQHEKAVQNIKMTFFTILSFSAEMFCADYLIESLPNQAECL